MTGEINLSLSAKSAVTFYKGDARQDNTDVLQGLPIVASRAIIRLKAWNIGLEKPLSVQSLVSCSVEALKIRMLRAVQTMEACEISEACLRDRKCERPAMVLVSWG